MNANSRLEWIDSLKAIAIFWIYLGHFGDNAKQLYPFVFSFHVPLFFFISGIFVKQCASLSDLSNIATKSFKRILIPYFAFSIISLIFFSLYHNYDFAHVKELAKQILPGIRNQIFAASLWFLPCLFVMILMHSFMQLILKNKHIVFMLCIIIFFASSIMKIGFQPSVFFNVDSALRYVVYYALGAYFSDYIKGHKEYTRNLTAKAITYIVCLLSIALFIYVYFYGASSVYSGFNNEYLIIFASFIVTVMMFVPNII
ncbi:TPA: acyltransferase family protein, partial [Enterobacter kobei]|nr:acyltransferase family protein [Enterobacter kobei]